MIYTSSQKLQQQEKNNIIVNRNIKKFLITANSLNSKILHQIFQCSKNEGVHPELLFSIIVIEKMNRGNLFNAISERILSKILPSLLNKIDVSLGLGQVRISTAKRVCDLPSIQLVPKLVNPFFNIKIVSKLLKIYTEQAKDHFHSIKTIVNLYTTGKLNPVIKKELYIYYNLIIWSIRNRIFHKMY